VSSSSDEEDISNEEVDACTRISHGVLAASSIAGFPVLSLTIYPFSIATDEHVPLQHFER